MPQTTANLALPLIAAAQAGKHVTHNEGLAALDTLVQLACLDKDLTEPPADPAEGDRYLVVSAEPSGAWSGLAGRVARYQDGAWIGFPPRPGWLAFVVDEADLYLFDGTDWTSFRRSLTALQNLAVLGIGTEADAANPFAAKLNAALWAAKSLAEGGTGNLRIALSKAAPGNVLSLQFQDAYSGRAELGLAGEDSLSLKVSADGAAWREAWRVDPATGFFGMGGVTSPAAPLHLAGTGAAPVLRLDDQAASGAPVVGIEARIGRGTMAVPAPILSGDRFFSLSGRGTHAGGGVSAGAIAFEALAEEDFTAGAQGTGFVVRTTDLATTTPRTTVRFRANGALELTPRAAPPASGTGAGQIVFDSTAEAFKAHGGMRWSRMTNLARFSASTNFDNYIGAGTWTKVQFNIGDVNDQGVFTAAGNRFVAPEAGTYTLGASLAYRRNGASAPTAFQARFHRNGTATGRSRAAVSNPVDGVSTLGLTVTLALQAGDAVEVFVLLSGADGYVAAIDSGFWGLAVP